MASTALPIPPESGVATQTPLWRTILLLWLGLSALVTAIHWPNITNVVFPDPDDTLRLIQVRDWLAGQNWFDVHQYRMNPPLGGPMHWSRLVDIPIAAMILLLRPLLGPEGAEMGALILVPLLTLGVAMQLVARLGVRLYDRQTAVLAAAAILMASMVLFQLRPMRIDHHGWQMVLALGAMLALLDQRVVRGGVIMGLMLAIWLNISMEALPFAVIFLGVSGLGWLQDNAQRWRLASAAGTLFAASAMLFAGTRGLGDLANYCDAVSPVYLMVLGLAAGACALMAVINPANRFVLLGGFGAAGLGIAAAAAGVAPQCTSGAFAELDPLVRQFWLERVGEGLPIWEQTPPVMAGILVTPLVALYALARRLWSAPLAPENRNYLAYALVIAGSFAISLLVARSSSIAVLIALPAASAIVLQWLARARTQTNVALRLAMMLLALLALAPSVAVKGVMRFTPAQALEDKVKAAEACQVQASLSALNRFDPAIMLVPLDISPAMLYATQHKVLASGHHRNDAAMADLIRAFGGDDATAREIVDRRQIDYIGYCPGMWEPMVYERSFPDGLMARLEAGKTPDWLEPVKDPALGQFRLWKVREQQPST